MAWAISDDREIGLTHDFANRRGMTDEELEGCIAHEHAHIDQWHPDYNFLNKARAFLINAAVIANAVYISQLDSVSIPFTNIGGLNPIAAAMLSIVPTMIVTAIAIQTGFNNLWRKPNEFDADRRAFEMTGHRGLESLMVRHIPEIERPEHKGRTPRNGVENLLSSHPLTELRIKRLRAMGDAVGLPPLQPA